MSPLEYLRTVARRRKLATGGIVRYDPDKPLQLGGGSLVPTRPAPATYEGVTVRPRGYTETTPEERRQFLDSLNAIMGHRPQPGPASRERAMRTAAGYAASSASAVDGNLGCPCGIVYSRCYYPLIHTARRR